MKSNRVHTFKCTFSVLSIMCCILLLALTVSGEVRAYTASATANRVVVSQAESTLPANDTENNISNNTTSPTKDTASPANDTKSSPGNTTTSSSAITSGGSVDVVTPPAVDIEDKVKTITITAVGDIMTHKDNLNAAYNSKTKTYDFSDCFKYIAPELKNSDLVIGNFETVTAGLKAVYSSYPSFNTPDELLKALASSGFDVLSTANNHCLDRGVAGLTRTIQQIQENGMTNVGSSIDGKNKYVTKEINGIKVSILAYTYAFNSNDSKLSQKTKEQYLSPINEAQIKKDIQSVRSQGTDAVIVIMHWGNEYQRQPSTYQTTLAKKIFQWGGDIILGSHPHVVQKSEIMKVNGENKYVIYSMGNIVSGYRRTDTAKRPNKIYTEDGVIVKLTIEKDANNKVAIKAVNHIPTWLDKYYVSGKPVFSILPIPSNDFKAGYINTSNALKVKQSYKNTMDLMYNFK